MRVLHLDTGRRIAGGQIQMRLLVEGLRKAGVECGVDSPLWREPLAGAGLRHCHDAGSHSRARTPFVVSRRVGFPVRRTWLSRWKYSRAAAYLAVSNYTAKTLLEAGVPESKVFVVPDGAPSFERGNRASGRVLLLSKNGLSVPGTVPVADLKEDLRDCDVFVYLSDMEGFGSAALAAQAAGVPVVASNVGGLPEAVRFGVMVENRIDAILEGIGRARTIDAGEGPAWVESNFSVGRMVASTLDVYRRVLSC